MVCEEGDFDASFFLTNYYLNAGNMEKASVYMNEALHVESEYLDKPATNLAKEKLRHRCFHSSAASCSSWGVSV